ncbi:MAG: hypothetical protein UY28_C0004G0021 [Candidatus Amesbacteria bacterium GW2011_GWB1_48_13]|uniref:Uncharacterized protein n=1 Tax=Candidatus Amesbacteria bacterium GW2011_GWB1_48_13 TaxID=1618362 RepID=A0A0G1X6N9_9BACT|nr:MAG: hypothetical protein UY28_C0004G0021 [Candidatus Amesbacteria bacterium GW2011_GWB1_48_13]
MKKPKKWCEHITWDIHLERWVFDYDDGIYLGYLDKWDRCPIRGCGKRRPK